MAHIIICHNNTNPTSLQKIRPTMTQVGYMDLFVPDYGMNRSSYALFVLVVVMTIELQISPVCKTAELRL
jgi:hypothetical protein